MITGLIALLAIAILSTSAMAQQERPYKAVGAPVDPKVTAHWNRYHGYPEATDMLKRLAKAHPKRARLESVGKSFGGRDMWVMTITEPSDAGPRKKPAFWIDGGIHANEVQTVQVVLYTAWFLLEMCDQNDQVKQLLTERVFYLAPMLSPDSRDAHFRRPNTTHSPRGGQRPVDDDRDGLVDEDGPDDLDGDGHLTLMRVRDRNGKFKPHPDYPEQLVRVKPGEQGQFTLLGIEGFDNDGDGRVNEDADGYYDTNRDWAWGWQPKYVQGGAYRYPFSVPENRYVADFIMAHPNIAAAQSYHNTGGMLLRGPGVKIGKIPPEDVKVFDALGKRGQRMLPGYRYLTLGSELYESHGVELDWIYQMVGAYTLTNELFTERNFFGPEGRKDGSDQRVARREFDKYLLLGEGFVPWRPVDHPQFGKIEVGGKKKNWGRQPPSFLLEEECHRNMAFTLYHADQMPLVAVQSIERRPVSDGLVEVTAVIQNDRLQPTHAAIDITRKITPPDIVSISGEKVRVIVGMQSTEQFFRNPKSQRRRPDRLRLENVPGHGVVYVRWLIEGNGPVTVTVESVKGGTHSMTSPEAE